MSRALAGVFSVVALIAGCTMERAVLPRMERNGGASDAATSSDASVRTDASAPPLGPVRPGPALDGIDRTRDAACPASARWAVGVVGRVIDEDGTPRSGVAAQSCLLVEGGRRVCLAPERTGADGVFTIAFGESLRCLREIALRVVEPHATVSTAYVTVPRAPVDAVLYASSDVIAYALTPATMLPPTGDEHASRVVRFSGAELTIAPAMLDEGTYESLSARVLRGAEAASASFLGEGEPFVLLATFGPESRVDAAIPGAFRLLDTGLAAGTRVGLFTLSGLYTRLPDGTMAREGHWLPLADALVDESGAITPPPGVGVTELGWIGVTVAR